jgi:hypothetical protein
MTKLFENENMISENSCEVLMNDIMEEKFLQECEKKSNLQIESS